MCGLFGFTCYGQTINNLSELTNSLSFESAVRGTDATGVAYFRDGNLQITKDAKSAYNLKFKHSDDIRALIGHTRHSTQGSEKKNQNNHPFCGKLKSGKFALAHNGVLTNDQRLRHTFSLPKTKIETDSYIAVQLIEQQKKIDFESIAWMAEQVEGSFSFSILDNENHLYLVKGDSPLSILHFPTRQIFVYASTDEILFKALIDSPLFDDLKSKNYEPILLTEGTILRISSDGTIDRKEFQCRDYYGLGWWEYGTLSHTYTQNLSDSLREEYIEDLKTFAAYQGIDEETIDILLKEGWSFEDIEEFIYCPY